MTDNFVPSDQLRKLASSLRYWVRERQSRTGLVVTADDLMARTRRRLPNATEEELEWIYQKVGNV